MKKTYSIQFKLAILILLSVFALGNVSKVHAQARTLTIIPPRFELFGNPGDSITETIRIRNESDQPTGFALVVEDFSAAGEEGHVVLEGEPSENSFSLATWIESSTKEVILQPNEERPVAFTINIPRNAEPGGHYASILFSSAGESTPGGASVTQRIGTLILLRVSGNVVEDATVETFEAPSHSQGGPVNLTLRMRNDGNVHVRPKGTIIITNLFNQKVDEIPLNGANVIPGAVRKMDTTWDRNNLLGIYTATLVGTYGQQNTAITTATRFSVASTTSIILISIGLLAGIIFIISLITGRKRLAKALKVIASG